MSKWIKILCAAVASFAVLFISVGYAAVTGTLTISGSAAYISEKTPALEEGIHITAATVNAALTAGEGSVTTYANTTLTSTVDTTNGQVTFDITITNNTLYSQYFHGVVYDTGTFPDSSITYTLNGLQVGDALAPRADEILDSVSFQITFTNVAEMPVIKFDFQLTAPSDGGGDSEDPVEDPSDPVVIGAAGKFKEILNNEEDYSALINGMNTVVTGRNDASYIGNVVGAVSTDSTLLNNLFTEGSINYLTLDFDGEGGQAPVNVTAMIKRENIDGAVRTGDASGNELVLYLTAENPSESEDILEDNWLTTPWEPVTVYASVFTTNASGEWVQIGNMYQGIADANAYSGYLGAENDSFNTDTWVLNESVYGFTPAELTWRGTYTGTGLSEVIQDGYMVEKADEYNSIINS